jgi:hypothetical protein
LHCDNYRFPTDCPFLAQLDEVIKQIASGISL